MLHFLKRFLLVACWIICCQQVKAQNSRLHVQTDERMELLNVIQYLSDYPILTRANLHYKQEVDSYFNNYKDHLAVKLNKKIYRRFFGFDAPPTYIYHFSFPDFKQVSDFSQDDLNTYHFNDHRDTLILLLQAFKDFYNQTQFHSFYTSHKGFYNTIAAPVQQKLESSDIIKVLEEHYGQKNKSYNIILAPLEHDGGYGPQVQTPQGGMLYAIIGPRYDSKDMPEFDIESLLSEYVIHEFSHSFCNPLIAKYWSQLAQDSCLLLPIKASLQDQGYNSWGSCLYEHLVRANEIILTEKVFGKGKADSIYNSMINEDKWIYLDGLVPIIRAYTMNRKKYKTQEAIMPIVIAYFHERAKGCR